MSTEIEKAYSRGYHAGQKRAIAARKREHLRRERQAFWDRVFVASVSTCIDVNGWEKGDVPISDIRQRVALAKDFADEALKQREFVL